MRKYKIGISCNFEHNVSIWANGVNQNLVFLYNLFNHLDIVEEVYLVSWGPKKLSKPPEALMFDGLDLQYAYIDDVIDELDVLIEGTLLLEQSHVRKMHEHGGKVVCYKMGPDYIMDIECVLFDKKTGRIFTGAHFDGVWMIPQNENTCRSYLSIMLRSPAIVVPAIWEPIFCKQLINSLKEEGLEFNYQPNIDKKAKRISSFEPNIYIFKNCFTPILICEQAYRIAPEKIEHYYACNTYDKRENPTFFNFIGRTDIVANKIMSVEGRHKTPNFLATYTDIVLAHQWENGLNYAYNEALYGGYPLVHNSKLLPNGVGYYYSEFDAFDGAKVLLDVIDNHDKNHDEYVKRANDYLESLSPFNKNNLRAYENALLALFN